MAEELYLPPHANLDRTSIQSKNISLSNTAIKASLYGTTIPIPIVGILILVSQGPSDFARSLPILFFYWICSFIVALVITLSYGVLSHLILSKLRLRSNFYYYLAATFPGLIFTLSMDPLFKSGPFILGLIFMGYGLAVCFFGLRLLDASDTW